MARIFSRGADRITDDTYNSAVFDADNQTVFLQFTFSTIALDPNEAAWICDSLAALLHTPPEQTEKPEKTEKAE